MEFQTKFKEDLSLPLLNHHVKPEPDPETEYDFTIHDLDQIDNFSLMGPSFHPDYGAYVSGYDPFDPFSYGLDPNDLEFKPFEVEKENGFGMMQNYTGRGCFTTHTGTNYLGVYQPDHFMQVHDLTEDPKPVRFLAPDEGSCVTGENCVKKRNGNPCKGRKKKNSSKGQWTKEEDRVLKQMVEKYGGRKWSYIAHMLKGRIGKQCRERWHNHLRPNIKKDFWSEEEDRILIATHAQVGNKWSEIAKKLPGRTENSIKNHWNATKRRLHTERKCRSKWPKPSPILQNYINTLNLPPSTTTNTNNNNNPLDDLPDLDFTEVPEFALDHNLLNGDSIESLLDDIPQLNCGGEENKQLDLTEMISLANL